MSISLSGSLLLTGSIVASGNLTTTGTITAQTLVVQTITSSIVNITGSNIFGSQLSDRQTFTGSLFITGSSANFSNQVCGLMGNFSCIGIGMTSPQASLHVIRCLGSDVISIGESGTITRFAIGQEASYTGNYINSRNVDLKLQTYCSGGSGGNIHFQTGTDGTACVTTKMFLCSNGNLGIGTTTSCTRLEVFSTAASGDRTLPHNVLTITAEQGNAPYFPFGGAILFKNRSYTSGLVESSRIRSVIYDDGAPANCGGGIWFETTQTPGGTLTPSLVINYAGNVGIGTCSPSQRLEVVGGEIKAGRVDSSNEGGQLSFGRALDNNTAWYIDAYGNASSPQLRFVNVDNAIVAMTITGSNVTMNTLSISTTALHGIKTFEAGPTSAYNINLPAEFPNVLLTAGNVWGVRGKATFFNAGAAEVRDFLISRNSGGSWASANYGPSSCTSGGILQSVAGTGTCITINMNSNSYLVVEVTAMVR
jgi:hypothetical protein